MNSKAVVILKRFLKGFMAGGLASVAAQLASSIVISNLSDLRKLGASLAIAFLTGGILAIEKLVNWTPPQNPVPLPNEPQQ
jgi:hypothetical protein